MAKVNVVLNGKAISGQDGMTILELARENGVDIPTLCYLEGLPPNGSCRLCVVEVEGSRTLAGSCHTPIADGMVIQTHSPRVLATRRMILEMLLASHCGTCYMCDKANVCELRRICADLEIGVPRFQQHKRYYPVEDISPYVWRDLSKCILCRRCVRACTEIAKQSIYAIGYRSFGSKVVVDCDDPLNKEVCRDCDVCISACPTGALSQPKKVGQEKIKPLVIRG